MNTKLLMTSSAIVLGITGLLLSFLPQEILEYAGASSVVLFPIFLQLLGAAYLGFAMLNWMAKGNLIGGIYSRPVAIGNLAHFVIGGLALLKSASTVPDGTAMWIAGAVYTIFAALFAVVTFTHPIKEVQTSKA
ncbi:hypothetical protein H8S95_13340 [Pontibacter sp. KCTC 32443]|uniref:hypothetical protein n=1 Tax=Pontibacter TaxID=323449 RepID=UPI00164CEF27|nr:MULTISPECIES: hypothetical protein [Pontibacter]MBC5775055.1 hypothetical protein [Pontibacter sp. KCTC 32443]